MYVWKTASSGQISVELSAYLAIYINLHEIRENYWPPLVILFIFVKIIYIVAQAIYMKNSRRCSTKIEEKCTSFLFLFFCNFSQTHFIVTFLSLFEDLTQYLWSSDARLTIIRAYYCFSTPFSLCDIYLPPSEDCWVWLDVFEISNTICLFCLWILIRCGDALKIDTVILIKRQYEIVLLYFEARISKVYCLCVYVVATLLWPNVMMLSFITFLL